MRCRIAASSYLKSSVPLLSRAVATRSPDASRLFTTCGEHPAKAASERPDTSVPSWGMLGKVSFMSFVIHWGSVSSELVRSG